MQLVLGGKDGPGQVCEGLTVSSPSPAKQSIPGPRREAVGGTAGNRVLPSIRDDVGTELDGSIDAVLFRPGQVVRAPSTRSCRLLGRPLSRSCLPRCRLRRPRGWRSRGRRHPPLLVRAASVRGGRLSGAARREGRSVGRRSTRRPASGRSRTRAAPWHAVVQVTAVTRLRDSVPTEVVRRRGVSCSAPCHGTSVGTGTIGKQAIALSYICVICDRIRLRSCPEICLSDHRCRIVVAAGDHTTPAEP